MSMAEILFGGLNENGFIDAFKLRGTESIGVQFHPEYTSRPNIPNPIIKDFLKKSLRIK